MNKYNCPRCNTEMIPKTQEENCIQEYKCPICSFINLYDSLPLEDWEEGIDKFLEENMKIIIKEMK